MGHDLSMSYLYVNLTDCSLLPTVPDVNLRSQGSPGPASGEKKYRQSLAADDHVEDGADGMRAKARRVIALEADLFTNKYGDLHASNS